jgi:hypothetical protein
MPEGRKGRHMMVMKKTCLGWYNVDVVSGCAGDVVRW